MADLLCHRSFSSCKDNTTLNVCIIINNNNILLFTQTPIPGGLDGTIIDSRIIPVTTVVMLGYDWWLCMVINIISIHHTGRIFSPTITVNSRLLPVGNPFKIPCVLIFSL